MAGTLKYFYLIFSTPNDMSLDDFGKHNPLLRDKRRDVRCVRN